ncbi:LuxR family transcriptional regulator [Paenibacillus sp. GSMTC-2017]|uniref:LuxR C-terminal-related transcriptional regulator n=1 Tax=Paenibacillus sp. GSMTC-2017 TaxID=2794350 RepID=UPI0018D8DE9B|nr:LuxR C-terminal-related transcriptional regulator [Paenibacillus sp. GSMTC-2017]MBH5318445.1 LuxR family transcriptional regulator [Paenibacillus sp. GSMTC-2017]
MSIPILSTKLYIPQSRPVVVNRHRLFEKLNEVQHRKLTLISASAGFGKTTLISEWITSSKRRTAWLSLDEGDNDATRFLIHLISALQTIEANIGEGVFVALQSSQSLPIEPILTTLINEITVISDNFVLVLDDFHIIKDKAIIDAIAFLLEHLPTQMHIVISTREDPNLPLARLRVRDQLTELRVNDLTFTHSEVTEFLNKVMRLNLSLKDISLLETRTEGWIAGLQLAAISMHGHQDKSSFIKCFTGSHHFVLDYLIEEVLQQQSDSVQNFLLQTSILGRLSGPLCDAVLGEGDIESHLKTSISSQETLQYLEHANLFIVPLDNERRWYRYHHLFADLLRQRLHQRIISPTEDEKYDIAELHIRASKWYEDHGLDIEAFHHAVAANDIELATRLIDGKGMPLHFRGGATHVLRWLESQPTTVLDARPSLWVIFASTILMVGQLTGVEQKLQSAEVALQNTELDDKTRDVIGHIAAIRATLAVSQHKVEFIVAESLRALEYLHPDNLPVRTATTWTLGYAYQLQGDRAAANKAYTEAISKSQAIRHHVIQIMATIGLGNLQEADNQLYTATDTYRNVLKMVGDPPLPIVCEAHLGLARICYEWNDLEMAEHHLKQSTELAKQLVNTDRVIVCEVFHAKLKLAQGDVNDSAAIIFKANQLLHQHNFVNAMSDVADIHIRILLHKGNYIAASDLAKSNELPLSHARALIALEDISTALATLELTRQQVELKGWVDERLKVIVLQSVARYMNGDIDLAIQLLCEALALGQIGGFIRIFVDEGRLMSQLLSEVAVRGIMSDYISKILIAFGAGENSSIFKSIRGSALPNQKLIEPLSERELKILQLIALGLSNDEISKRLFLALSTVKGHNRNIFDKLQVQRRTEAVARARELGLL